MTLESDFVFFSPNKNKVVWHRSKKINTEGRTHLVAGWNILWHLPKKVHIGGKE